MVFKKIVSNTLSSVSALRHESYIFKTLNKSHSKDGLKLLAKQYQEQQPLSNAFGRSFSLSKEKRLQAWTEYWGMFSQNLFTNDISVGCFDAKTHQLIGISVAKDLNYVPQGFQEKFMKNVSFISLIEKLQEKLMGQVESKYQPLLKKTGVCTQIFGAALEKQHMGKKLLHKMILANELLSVNKGYQHSFVFTTNLKSGIALKKLNYQTMTSIKANQFEVDGVRYFQKVEQAQKQSYLYIKQLKQIRNLQTSSF